MVSICCDEATLEAADQALLAWLQWDGRGLEPTINVDRARVPISAALEKVRYSHNHPPGFIGEWLSEKRRRDEPRLRRTYRSLAAFVLRRLRRGG
jgi:hypothetical protein